MQKAHGMNVTTPSGEELLPLHESDDRGALEEEALTYTRQHPGVWISLDPDTWYEKHSRVTVNFFNREWDAPQGEE